jgi:CheY-like chemotaxis protein
MKGDAMSEVGSLGRSADILLVEDNPDDVNLNRLAFQQVDIAHQLHLARDGQEAMAFLRREGKFASAPRPDLILLDLNMPIKDGRMVLKEIKQDASLQRIPVIILTTSDSATDRILAYRHNANAYLVKPMDIDELYEMVQSIAHFWLKQVRHAPPASGGASAK